MASSEAQISKGFEAALARTGLQSGPLNPLNNPDTTPAPFPLVYRWDRQNRKGQPCRVTARGKMNSVRVEFPDGYKMITSGNALRRRALANEDSHP